MSDPVVLHLIESISRGGGNRAAFAVAKYVRRNFPSQHYLAPINFSGVETEALPLAKEAGLNPVIPSTEDGLIGLIEHADIVHLHWWNSPHVDRFLRSNLPPRRLVVWCHVGGHAPPQIVPPALFDFADSVVACSPYTYESPPFLRLSPEDRTAKTAMAYGPADFERLEGLDRQAHSTFNVGYIGTVHFVKMHRDYVAMSARVKIPDVRFIVCGSGGGEHTLKKEVTALGLEDRFEIRGYIDDIKPILSTLDVYGYPLCPDNYSGSELNLQEAMFAGIPVVTFPYGGVSRLVIDGYTGILVRSEREYAEAIEFLYHNPAERARIGENAARYAREIFGAAPAAQVFTRIYQELLQRPKQTRSWLERPNQFGQALDDSGADRFIASLGEFALPFIKSKYGRSMEECMEADAQIQAMSPLMRDGGIVSWSVGCPKDPYLLLWRTLGQISLGHGEEALRLLTLASQNGFTDWRIGWYFAVAGELAGQIDVALHALKVIVDIDPKFPGAEQLCAKIAARVPKP